MENLDLLYHSIIETYVLIKSGISRSSIGINCFSSSNDRTNFNFRENFELQQKMALDNDNFNESMKLPNEWLAHYNQCF